MWRTAPATIAAQEEMLGEQIMFTGEELADIIAFVHDDTEQHEFSEADIPLDSTCRPAANRGGLRSNAQASGSVPASQRGGSSHRAGGGDLGHQVIIPVTLDPHVRRSAQRQGLDQVMVHISVQARLPEGVECRSP